MVFLVIAAPSALGFAPANIPTRTARSVRSSSKSIIGSAPRRLLAVRHGLPAFCPGG